MSFQDFELITDKPHWVKCKECGAEIETGIARISEHWTSCSGKEFHSALMSMGSITNGKLNMYYVSAMKMQHLKSYVKK